MTDTIAAQIEEPLGISPERPTLVERALGLLPLPYGLAAASVAALLGPPGSLLVGYIETGSFKTSLLIYFHGYLPEHPWQQALAIVLWFAFYTLLFLVIHHARRSVSKSRKTLTPLLSKPTDFDEAFRALPRLWPALLIGLAIEAFFIGDYRMRLAEAPGPVSTIYEALSGPPLYLMSGTAIWVYAGAVGGLRRLGKGPLKLRPFYEDESMGLKPLATLSLSLSAAYFSLLLIMVLMFLIGPVRVEYVITVAGLLMLGLVFFFLPLVGAHLRMKEEKKALQATIRRRWADLLSRALDPNEPGEIPDRSTLSVLETLERRVDDARTWPVDLPILSKLGVMALTIIVALLTQIIAKWLGL